MICYKCDQCGNICEEGKIATVVIEMYISNNSCQPISVDLCVNCLEKLKGFFGPIDMAEKEETNDC